MKLQSSYTYTAAKHVMILFIHDHQLNSNSLILEHFDIRISSLALSNVDCLSMQDRVTNVGKSISLSSYYKKRKVTENKIAGIASVIGTLLSVNGRQVASRISKSSPSTLETLRRCCNSLNFNLFQGFTEFYLHVSLNLAPRSRHQRVRLTAFFPFLRFGEFRVSLSSRPVA